MWFKKNKWKIIVPLVIIAVLAAAFWYGGGAPGMQGWGVDKDTPSVEVTTPTDKQTKDSTKPTESSEDELLEQPTESPNIESRPGGTEGGMSAQEKVDTAIEMAGDSSVGVETGNEDYSASQGMMINPDTGKDKYMTDPVPAGKPIPVDPENAVISDTAYTCTLSVRCDTILNNINWLDPEKVELVPDDGIIFPATVVTFYDGESVFNVLQREMKKAKIHMEFENTPIYNSAYVEGINNLYEFDCGELSGWMYKVNNWFPNYGCSRYALKNGDIIEFVYTCDLGVDVGGFAVVG